MRVLVLGGDGYLGWPMSLHLSQSGHIVGIVDNLWKRSILAEQGVNDLFSSKEIDQKLRLWKTLTGREIQFWKSDVCNYQELLEILREFAPEAIIHFAEQPSAPFSMKGYEEAAFTLQNNLLSTLSLAHAVDAYDRSIHIIKLGTMGEYGTPNIDIEEGFIDIQHNGRSDRLLFPRQGSSLYHTTKIQDTDLLYLYVRTWGLTVTDLMQGPVYGFLTDETETQDDLVTMFCYDEVFGTVLNRFLVQAVCNHPLTVFGKGGQTRGYLNIRDTIQCVSLALEKPPKPGDMRILNQFTEVFSVKALAEKVRSAALELGIRAEVVEVSNPRVEQEEHFYNVKNTGLLELGLEPHLLTSHLLVRMLHRVLERKKYINRDVIHPRTAWRGS